MVGRGTGCGRSSREEGNESRRHGTSKTSTISQSTGRPDAWNLPMQLIGHCARCDKAQRPGEFDRCFGYVEGRDQSI